MQDIAGRLARVREEIESARAHAGSQDEITLVAVSKTVPLECVREAIEAGQVVFGENRVQDGAPKAEATRGQAIWHLVGHLQTNKVGPAVRAFSVIESVDSLKLALRLDAAAQYIEPLSVLLEVNIAGEASKFGFTREDCLAMMPELMRLSNLRLRGLMTVAPIAGNPEDVRWVFRSLRELSDRIRDQFSPASFDQLSMGMSDDYKVAIEEGATMVRLGRAIFGDRPD